MSDHKWIQDTPLSKICEKCGVSKSEWHTNECKQQPTDTQMLDWLSKNGYVLSYDSRRNRFCVSVLNQDASIDYYYDNDMRRAIAAAMEKTDDK